VQVTQESPAEVLSGRYAVERLLGHGSTASVFLATDVTTGAAVAIKAFRPDLAATVGARRFLREVAVLRLLDHPNILPLLRSDTAGGLLFFVGTSSRLFDGARVLVCDFGIARAIEAAVTDRSSSGFVLGTPAYMSPEQARGIGPLDARSDIYALACVVYEMLAGEPPLSGPTLQAIVARQARERPRRLRVVRPDLPAPVEAAIDQALSKEPLRRPRSAGAFVRALAGSPAE
jgi:serine/threonine-protein kinase